MKSPIGDQQDMGVADIIRQRVDFGRLQVKIWASHNLQFIDNLLIQLDVIRQLFTTNSLNFHDKE
jgi:hypothetical protein